MWGREEIVSSYCSAAARTIPAPLFRANAVPFLWLLNLTNHLAHGRLIFSEPTTPAVLCGHDTALEKLARGVTHMVWVAQQPVGIAEITDIEHESAAPNRFFIRTNELAPSSPRLRASSISRVYWMKWTFASVPSSIR
jgi:hypothetical protein